jgi:hypothetical protein
MDMQDKILGMVRNQLPQFNRKLLLEFRESQIQNSAKFIDTVYREAIKLLDGQVIYRGYQALTPEERVMFRLNGAKNKAKTVDILSTDLDIVRYDFEFENQIYHSYMHLPFLKDFAITISNSKYYIQMVITDTLFFHIQDGIGIKVLRGPINFWRKLKHIYKSMSGKIFSDDIITTKVHMRNTKSTKKDLKTTLLLYILINRGFLNTLDLFGIPRDWVTFVSTYDEKDTEHEYFRIRGICTIETMNIIPTAQELLDSQNEGFFLKVNQRIFEEGTQIQKRVISSLLYNFQYFEKCNSSMFENNQELIDSLYTSDVIYKVILGKTIYGMDLDKESQAHNHAEQHWSSLDDSYLDKLTQSKLEQAGIHCENIHDLFVYVFMNIDTRIVNHSPMNLYGKRFSVNDILLSGIVHAIFKRVYEQTKHKRPLTPKELAGILRAGSKEITKIYKHSTLVRSSPSIYNDNALLTILGKKNRATGSGSGNSNNTMLPAKKARSSKRRNIADQVEYWADPSMYAVESTNSNPSQNPGIGGTINPFAELDLVTGVILKPAHAAVLDEFARCLSSK